MRPLKYHVATSLDGFIAAPDGSFDLFPQRGDHVADFLDSWRDYDTVLMGRRTYEVGLAAGVTNPYPSMRSYVFSRSLEASPDPAVTLVRDDAVEAVRGLRAADGAAIYLCGGSVLAAQLFTAGLVDEMIVKLNPLLLGRGIPLFTPAIAPQMLTLRDARTYANGVVVLHYRVNPK